MFSTLFVSMVMLMAQPTSGPSGGGGSKMSNADALATIERFFADPKLGDDLKAINKFAEESEDCLVSLDEKIITWQGRTPPYKYTNLLTTAFVAGNVRAQLQDKKIADNPYAGMQAVLKVYNMLREKDKDLQIPEVDKYADLEKNGELKKHLESIAQGRNR